MIHVTIYNEFHHEQAQNTTGERARVNYPDGIHMSLKNNLLALEPQDFSITTYTLENVSEITKEVLDNTDVLIWWGHVRHAQVPDEVAALVRDAVNNGMGAIFLHSGHHSKPFRMLLGTPCHLGWRENGDRELVWVCNPAHPITEGIGRFISLEHEEVYCEPFAIPEPDELVFIGSFEGGEVFRAGCCYRRGNGRIFYFQPGHETYGSLNHPDVIRVICNAIRWAYPTRRLELTCPHIGFPMDNN